MPAALVSIWRNKRRSMAMLFGIILGTVIISSVVIYTGILQKENYESVVENTAYEASFRLLETGTESELWGLAEQIMEDERVESTTVFGGVPQSSPFGGGPHFGLRMRGEATMRATLLFPGSELQTPDTGSDITPYFVRGNFTGTTIYERMIGERLEVLIRVDEMVVANLLRELGDTVGGVDEVCLRLILGLQQLFLSDGLLLQS